MFERVPIACIMTPADEVIFYDPSKQEELRQFCKERAISYLPSCEERDTRCFEYQKNKNSFHSIPIDNLKIDANTYIFDDDLIENFQKNHVLFVFKNNKFVGIIHFSDYNRDAVSIYLYSLVLKYETSLRKLLKKLGFVNQNVIDYLKILYKNDYKPRSNRRYLEEFQSFDLIQIIKFANKKNILNYSNEIKNRINEIRKSIMHFHDKINRKSVIERDFIYKLDSFNNYIDGVNILKKEIDFIESMLMK